MDRTAHGAAGGIWGYHGTRRVVLGMSNQREEIREWDMGIVA